MAWWNMGETTPACPGLATRRHLERPHTSQAHGARLHTQGLRLAEPRGYGPDTRRQASDEKNNQGKEDGRSLAGTTRPLRSPP